jgi:4'-phosphopantetheinyl transferase
VSIVREPSGRLRLGGIPADIDFNVSHSSSLAAVAVARSRRIGVDVEAHRTDRDLRSLVPEVMGVREREMLHGLDGAEFVRAFYACWTRKEAIVKGIGVGIAYPLPAIDIPEVPPDGVVRLPEGDSAAERVWLLQSTEMPSGFSLSIALAGSSGTIAVSWLPCSTDRFAFFAGPRAERPEDGTAERG